MTAAVEPVDRPGPPGVPRLLVRFDRIERAVHWVTALLLFVLIFTGAALYAGPVSTLVGQRGLVRDVHTIAGFALPLPVAIAVLARRRGAALRRDLGELNRSSVKFNVGQRLNAAFLGASGLVLLGTGIMLKWFEWFSVDLRTGATFVHDWFAIGVAIAVLGHIAFAMRDPVALSGMWRGSVTSDWAGRTRPQWFERETGVRAGRLKAGETTRSAR